MRVIFEKLIFGQRIFCSYQNRRVFYRIHKSQILNYFHTVHTFTPCLFKIHFNEAPIYIFLYRINYYFRGNEAVEISETKFGHRCSIIIIIIIIIIITIIIIIIIIIIVVVFVMILWQDGCLSP